MNLIELFNMGQPLWFSLPVGDRSGWIFSVKASLNNPEEGVIEVHLLHAQTPITLRPEHQAQLQYTKAKAGYTVVSQAGADCIVPRLIDLVEYYADVRVIPVVVLPSAGDVIGVFVVHEIASFKTSMVRIKCSTEFARLSKAVSPTQQDTVYSMVLTDEYEIIDYGHCALLTPKRKVETPTDTFQEHFQQATTDVADRIRKASDSVRLIDAGVHVLEEGLEDLVTSVSGTTGTLAVQTFAETLIETQRALQSTLDSDQKLLASVRDNFCMHKFTYSGVCQICGYNQFEEQS